MTNEKTCKFSFNHYFGYTANKQIICIVSIMVIVLDKNELYYEFARAINTWDMNDIKLANSELKEFFIKVGVISTLDVADKFFDSLYNIKAAFKDGVPIGS
ncbi:MAG: hypothetical protein HC877_18955 [Thioploca sp.]|nr:hypothetical protein [Thioploca sp.]